MTVLTCLWFCFWRRLSDDNRAFLGSGPYLNRDGIASSLKCFRTFSPISCARKSISKQLGKKCSLQTRFSGVAYLHALLGRAMPSFYGLAGTCGNLRLLTSFLSNCGCQAQRSWPFSPLLNTNGQKGWTGSHGHNTKGRNRKTFRPLCSNLRISREPFTNQPRTIDVLTSQRTADHCNAARILPKMAEY